MALQRFDDGAAQSRRTILIQQLEKLRRLSAGGLALRECQVQKHFALRDGLLQAARGRGREWLALYLEHRFPMCRTEHRLPDTWPEGT